MKEWYDLSKMQQNLVDSLRDKFYQIIPYLGSNVYPLAMDNIYRVGRNVIFRTDGVISLETSIRQTDQVPVICARVIDANYVIIAEWIGDAWRYVLHVKESKIYTKYDKILEVYDEVVRNVKELDDRYLHLTNPEV